jgi:hypothetical protein
MDENDLYLGDCCACHGTRNVRNLVMHDKRAPVPGTGWGCVLCDLPMDGAVSVLCDDCAAIDFETHEVYKYEVCVGYPKENRRQPLASLTEPFGHDLRFHVHDAEMYQA